MGTPREITARMGESDFEEAFVKAAAKVPGPWAGGGSGGPPPSGPPPGGGHGGGFH